MYISRHPGFIDDSSCHCAMDLKAKFVKGQLLLYTQIHFCSNLLDAEVSFIFCLQAVKARLDQERDLDGIDSSNIVQGGRRARTAAATRIDYK